MVTLLSLFAQLEPWTIFASREQLVEAIHPGLQTGDAQPGVILASRYGVAGTETQRAVCGLCAGVDAGFFACRVAFVIPCTGVLARGWS